MKYRKYVDPNDYDKVKSEYSAYPDGMGPEIYPVDLNYGCVPMDTSQKAKTGVKNLAKAAESIKHRFGL